ncbi:MAG: phosphomannomutase/phosphoglucomutase [Candidatus Kerfeldbacteria bacterium]|nr:phosphomannomutase/phosphoglucomutase [Candidatus Kerfeldbacteria bacterium]
MAVPALPKIFKAYDIRGVYPDELNEDIARHVARAYVAYTGAKRIALGRDMRTSSPALFQALADEFVKLGMQVDDIGLIPTEAIYYTAGAFDYDAALIVTASHNPAEYNGMKMMNGKDEVVPGKVLGEYVQQGKMAKPRVGGALGRRDIFAPFIEHVLKQVDLKALRPLKIVVDAGNGMAGKVIPALQPRLPFEIVPMYFELDGHFPNRPSNPLLPGALDALKKKVVAERAVCGIAFDGDCDRIFFIDEQGEFVQADMTLLLIAEELLRKQPGATIIYNAICSRAVPEFIRQMGGVPVRTAVGFANVKKGLLEHRGALGGEVSAHYAFPENFYADSGFIAMLKVLELVSRADQPLSALVGRFMKYVRLDEVNFKVPDVEAEMQKIRKYFKGAEQDELDGVTVSYPDWWVNVRPSNTEPLLRVTVEGNTRELAEEKQKEVLTVLGVEGRSK